MHSAFCITGLLIAFNALATETTPIAPWIVPTESNIHEDNASQKPPTQKWHVLQKGKWEAWMAQDKRKSDFSSVCLRTVHISTNHSENPLETEKLSSATVQSLHDASNNGAIIQVTGCDYEKGHAYLQQLAECYSRSATDTTHVQKTRVHSNLISELLPDTLNYTIACRAYMAVQERLDRIKAIRNNTYMDTPTSNEHQLHALREARRDLLLHLRRVQHWFSQINFPRDAFDKDIINKDFNESDIMGFMRQAGEEIPGERIYLANSPVKS